MYRGSILCAHIIHTDFITDVGPIVHALAEIGIDAVGYHGEVDAPLRQEVYMKWKSTDVKVNVATKAFEIGINKLDIRHVVRNGVPENIFLRPTCITFLIYIFFHVVIHHQSSQCR